MPQAIKKSSPIESGFPESRRLPIRIGKYLILEKIGSGGMAEVYLGKTLGDSGFEKMLAVKRILPNYTHEADYCEMFEFEAKLSSRLSHPNIVQIYDFIRSEEDLLFVMEYVAGKNVAQLQEKLAVTHTLLPVDCALYVINEVLQALDYAHTRTDELTGKRLNIIHRDVSPRNIMISYDSPIKLLDFGIAKARDRSRLTQTGSIRGTGRYLSPERAIGLTEDHRSDLFSVGVILYELLCGKYLFDGENQFITLKMIQSCETVNKSIDELEAPVELKNILHRALTLNPANRYGDAAVFHLDVQEYCYQNFSSLAPKKLAKIVNDSFSDEIKHERERLATLEKSLKHFITSGVFPPEIPSLPSETLIETNIPIPQSNKRPSLNQRLYWFLIALIILCSLGSIYFFLKGGREGSELTPVSSEPKLPLPQKKLPVVSEERLPSGECRSLVESDPIGARVYMNGLFVGMTPTHVQVRCAKDIVLALERVGYVRLERKVRIVDRDSKIEINLIPIETP